MSLARGTPLPGQTPASARNTRLASTLAPGRRLTVRGLCLDRRGTARVFDFFTTRDDEHRVIRVTVDLAAGAIET